MASETRAVHTVFSSPPYSVVKHSTKTTSHDGQNFVRLLYKEHPMPKEEILFDNTD